MFRISIMPIHCEEMIHGLVLSLGRIYRKTILSVGTESRLLSIKTFSGSLTLQGHLTQDMCPVVLCNETFDAEAAYSGNYGSLGATVSSGSTKTAPLD